MDELEQRDQEFFTSCEDCCFAEFDRETQVGCKVGRLSKWQMLRRTTQMTNEETKKRYFNINTFCNMLRPLEYTTKFPNAVEQVKIDSGVQICVVINALALLDGDLLRVIDSLTAQTIKPRKIIVVHYKRRSPYGQISTTLKHSNIPYDLVNLLDSDNYEQLMDAAAKKGLGQYITFTDQSLPLDFIERINKVINDELRPLSLVTGKFLTVQLALYNKILGNLGQTIQSKIEEMAQRQGFEKMVISYEELYK